MSIRNAYHEMTSFSALLQAEQEVAKGKSDRQDVLRFEYDLEANLHEMSAMLRRMEIPKVWYKSFYVYTPKTRKVIYIDYTSKVIQRAAYDYINPKLVKTFIPDTYACIQDRGQLKAMLRAKQWMEDTRRIPGDWYYYKFDVAKFFYRIDHQVLLRLLEKRIGDRQVVELLEYYICNPSRPFGLPLYENQNEVSDADMLFEVGIPIGGGLSHMLGNLYLDPLDQYAKRELGCGRYIRYMDDIIIFDTSKERLKETGKRMEGFLNDRLLLEFNSKTAHAANPVWAGVRRLRDLRRSHQAPKEYHPPHEAAAGQRRAPI